MIKISKKLLIVLLVVALFVGAGSVILLAGNGVGGVRLYTQNENRELEEMGMKFSKLNKLFSYIEELYYKPVDEAELLEGAYEGAFQALNDPYSQYVRADDTEEFMNQVLGTFYGVGMTFQEVETGVFEIISVVADSPSEKAGVVSGEKIIAVDGVPAKDHSSDEVRDMIRGENGTKVVVTLARRDGTQHDVSLVRARLSELTVSYAMQENSIGLIQVSQFGEKTDAEFAAAIDDLTSQGAVALVIDLRYNGGGLVDAANRFADYIMDAGTLVYTLDSQGNRSNYITLKGRTELPYAILVNEYTASASEIVAAGVQDNKEGIIVGTKTFGKGIIQESFTLTDGSAVKLTVMQYFSPSGKAIHEVGVTPDYIVELPVDATDDYQYNKAVELLLQNKEVSNGL